MCSFSASGKPLHGPFYGFADWSTFVKCMKPFTGQCMKPFTVVSTDPPMHEVVYHCMRPFTPMGLIQCMRSFTLIFKNQCTRSFTTFSGFRRPVAIGRKEGEKSVLCGRKTAWNRLLCRQIVDHGGLYCALLRVMCDFIPLMAERLKTPLKSTYSESVKIRFHRLPTLATYHPAGTPKRPGPTE